MEKNYILVGKVAGSHGLKGGLNIVSFAEDLSLFKSGSKFILKDSFSGELEFFETLSASRKKSNIILVMLKDVDGRDKADQLKGRELYVEKEALPEPEDDTWYWHDLIGMNVVEEDGNILGNVKNLMRTGSSDILEVVNGKTEVLVPFLKEIITSVSLSSRQIVVKLPEGLLE